MADLGPYRETVGIRQVTHNGVKLEAATRLEITGGTAATETAGDGVKTYKLDLSAMAAMVAGVTGTAPIVVDNSDPTNPIVSIDAASGSAPGSMSAAHYALVNGAVSAATASTLILRDGLGRAKVADPSANDDIDTKGARDTAIAAISSTLRLTRSWSCANVIAGTGPITPAYVPMGSAMVNAPSSSVRQERAIIKMRPISATVQGVAGSGAGTIRFEIYVGGSATGDYVELANNTTGINATAMPIQDTINQNDVFDLRYTIVSGSTVSAMLNVCITILFEEVP
jgi:hypothetical protein